MRRLIGITLLGLFAVAVTVYGQSPATRNPLVGAWRVTEIDDANRPPITNPQPGLYIFTEQHYSFARINGTGPLPDYPSNDKATDADKVAVFNALYLNTGTYTVTANIADNKSHGGKERVRHRRKQPVRIRCEWEGAGADPEAIGSTHKTGPR